MYSAQPKLVNLNPLLPSLQVRTRRLAGSHIEVEWISSPNLSPIAADPEELELALLELVIRARATLPRGGRLVVQMYNVELGDQLAADSGITPGSYVLVEMTCLRTQPWSSVNPIVDDLFAAEPNLAVDSRLNVGHILEQNGGLLREYSEPGKALTLRAYLPSIGVLSQTPKMSKGAKSRVILLVEDEGFVRDVAAEILESMGFTVVAAENGSDAIALFHEKGPVHLLVTDVVMPGMNGRELANRLTDLQPDLKIIFMSGYPNDALSQQNNQTSDFVYLPKPFTMEALGNKVREVLGDKV